MHITGVVLAGGLSRRMGKDKATLQRNGQSMLWFGCELLEALPVQDIVINANVPHSLPYQVISDHYPTCGPLSGLHAVMQAMHRSTDALLCIPIDQPHMTKEVLLELINTGQFSNQVTHFDNQPLPIWLPTHNTLLNELETRLALPRKSKEQYRLSDFCRHVQAIALPTEDAHTWVNTNTPEQWQAALAGRFKRP